MSDDQHFDVIGTGAGGGTFAHRLASCGKWVLMLKRGGYLPRERDNRDSTEVFVKGKYRASEFWYDHNGGEFPPEVNYDAGGNTKMVDTSFFPSIGAVNPSLTGIANALRMGDHVLERLG